MNAFAEIAASWLGTFALHSTLAAGAALLCGLLLQRRGLAWQEALGRFALVAALVTSSAQVVLGTHGLELGTALAVAPPPERAGNPVAAGAVVAPLPLDRSPVPATPARQIPRVPTLLVLVAAVSALFGVGGLVAARRRVLRQLAARRPETSVRVRAIARQAASDLGLGRAPRLSRSATVASPLVFGGLRPEVCLPERAVELADDELRAMLCHELAHVRRGDLGWLWTGAILSALFPWQMLLLPLRRRLSAIAELRCDAEARRRTSPGAVAQCLVQVAAWFRERPLGIGALAMAARPSALRHRVEAVLGERADGRVRPALAALLAGLGLAAFTLAAPGVPRARATATAANAPAGDARLLPLRAEQRRLLAEAASLRAELTASGDEDLRPLLDLLEVRLAAMTATSERLEALLATRESEGNPLRERMR